MHSPTRHPYTRGLLASIPKIGVDHDRLVTIDEIVKNPEEFKKLPGADQGITPWWPWNDKPADLKPLEGPAGDYCLKQVADNHWVGVWRTEAVTDDQSPPPQLAYRVVEYQE